MSVYGDKPFSYSGFFRVTNGHSALKKTLDEEERNHLRSRATKMKKTSEVSGTQEKLVL